jgi:adenosylcobinamide-GDP ribazoletransferase
VNDQWRLFLAALRFVIHRPGPTADSVDGIPAHGATRFVPLVGIGVGLVGAGTYWLGAEVWPTSVAVVVSMLATVLATANFRQYSPPKDPASAATLDVRGGSLGALYWVFVLLIKYNALMALSAASVPVSLPTYLTLGLIMVAGQAASRALVVSVMATDTPAVMRVTTNDLTVALMVGLAPAALLGIPGLVGLVAAIMMRLGLTAVILRGLGFGFRERLDITQQLTEVSFYLGALAAWKYI